MSPEIRAAESDLIPLVGHAPKVKFPTNALPGPVAQMVRAVSIATQTDPAMAGTTALSVLSAAAVGRAEVEVRSGWREILALFTVTIARPGERKSAVNAAMSTPLLDVEQELVEAGQVQRQEAEATKAVASRAAEKAQRAAGSAAPEDRDPLLADAISAMAMAEQVTVPAVPRLIADDITPEAVSSLLAEQGGRLAVLSAEGGVLDILAGRYSSLPNLDPFLKGHAGDPLRVDRRGRPPEYVRRPALAVGLMVQPAVLDAIGRNVAFRGRGLLARFLYSRPTSKVGRRASNAPPAPAEVVGAYAELVKELARGLNQWTDPMVLQLDTQAQADLVAVEEAVEPQLAPNGTLGANDALAEWGSKFIGAVMRIAALLHLAEHGSEVANRRPISAETFERAGRLGAYYRDQAIAAFGEMGTDPATADAVYLLGRISRHDQDTITVRDMLRLAQRFKSRDQIDAPVSRLVDHGYLTPVEVEHVGVGRPPAPAYLIHPDAVEHLTELTQLTQPPENGEIPGISGAGSES